MPVRYNANSDILGVIDHPPGALTITAWVKPATNPTNTSQIILAFISLDGPYLGLYGEVSGQHIFIVSSDTGEFSSSATLALGTWAHVAMVWDGTTITAYINGANAWSHAASPALTGTVYTLLGAAGGAGWFDGSMSDVKVWSATLSATEIATEYRGSAPQRTSNLWSYWTLVSASDLADASGNARALGLFGTSPTTDTAGPGAFGQETYGLSAETSSISVSGGTSSVTVSDSATLSDGGTRVATDGLTDAAQMLDASVIVVAGAGVVVLTGATSTHAVSTAALGSSGGREVMPNNGQTSTLAVAINGTDTALTIASGDASGWVVSGVYRAILWQDPLNGPWEIVKVTSSQGGAGLTVERATEPTSGVQTARAWPIGTAIAGVATYTGLNALLTAVDVHTPEVEFTPAAAATTVTLTDTPEQILMVTRNGVVQSQAAGHYSVSGKILTFGSSFSGSERVIVSYSLRG